MHGPHSYRIAMRNNKSALGWPDQAHVRSHHLPHNCTLHCHQILIVNQKFAILFAYKISNKSKKKKLWKTNIMTIMIITATIVSKMQQSILSFVRCGLHYSRPALLLFHRCVAPFRSSHDFWCISVCFYPKFLYCHTRMWNKKNRKLPKDQKLT